MKHPTLLGLALLVLGVTIAVNITTIALSVIAVAAIVVGGKCYRQRLLTPPPPGDFQLTISRRRGPSSSPVPASPGQGSDSVQGTHPRIVWGRVLHDVADQAPSVRVQVRGSRNGETA